MRTDKLKLSCLIIGGALAGLAASGSVAHASRSLGALGAQVRVGTGSTASCITNWAQGVENDCSSWQTVTEALPIDSSNTNFNPVVNFYGDTSTQCRAVGLSYDQTAMYTPGWVSGFVDSRGGATWSNRLMGATFVPSSGQLIIECSLQPNAKLSSFSW